MNVSIPPSVQTSFRKTISRSKLTHTAIKATLSPPRAELTVVPSTTLMSMLENEIPHKPKPAKTTQRRNELSDGKQLIPGTHIWYGGKTRDDKPLNNWAFHKFARSDEYEILEKHAPELVTVKRLKTGKTYKVRFPENLRLKLAT